MTAQKDTVYIDVDDEITSIVEKVQKSPSKIVALVLPKRAVVLQSIVNMKLLKRTADEVSKRVVLITSEAGLMPLAGAVGVYTAKNLQSKPEIPAAPETPELNEELLETEEAPEDPELDNNATIGELDGDEIADDDDVFESAAVPAAAGAAAATARTKAKKGKAGKDAKAPKPKKDKKNKVPNFDRFRKRIFIGALAGVALLVLCYLAFFVAPKAKVTIQTETSTVNSSINFTASTSATSVDVAAKVVPAKEVTADKTDSQKVAASGQKDLGSKASGSVTLTIKYSDCPGVCPLAVPAGTGVSSGGLTFLTTERVSLINTSASGLSGTVGVIAQNNGDQYNLSAGRTFTVAGYSSVTGTNPSAMSGGVSKIAKVVSQQDVDTAKQKITDSSQEVKTDLQKQLEDQGYYALLDSFKTKSETITASPQVDQEGSEVTVTAARTYSMTGVKRDDLHALIVDSVKSDTEDRKQQVQDDGINNAVFRINDSKQPGSTSITMQVPVILGPKIDTEALKKQIAGKKKGDIDSIVKAIDGVKDVNVQYSPFWVSITPKNTNKITIVYEEAKD